MRDFTIFIAPITCPPLHPPPSPGPLPPHRDGLALAGRWPAAGTGAVDAGGARAAVAVGHPHLLAVLVAHHPGARARRPRTTTSGSARRRCAASPGRRRTARSSCSRARRRGLHPRLGDVRRRPSLRALAVVARHVALAVLGRDVVRVRERRRSAPPARRPATLPATCGWRGARGELVGVGIEPTETPRTRMARRRAPRTASVPGRALGERRRVRVGRRLRRRRRDGERRRRPPCPCPSRAASAGCAATARRPGPSPSRRPSRRGAHPTPCPRCGPSRGRRAPSAGAPCAGPAPCRASPPSRRALRRRASLRPRHALLAVDLAVRDPRERLRGAADAAVAGDVGLVRRVALDHHLLRAEAAEHTALHLGGVGGGVR